MKAKYELSEKEIEAAISEYVERTVGEKPKRVTVTAHCAPGNDPRDHNYVSATAELDDQAP